MWFAIMSRPDVSNAVRAVVRRSRNSVERRWKAVMNIMAYLHGTRELGLTFVKVSA